jgi:hypothetical protein
MKDPLASSQATLADILCHRTGLAPHNALWYIGPFNRSDLLYRLRYLDPVPVPGGTAFRTMFVYNNLMYGVAGHLLEILFGTSYEDILESRILGPLGMAATSLTLADLTGSANYAKGYELANELPLRNWTNIGPAAEVNSNVLDMAKWVQLFLRKGLASDGSKMISDTLLERMYVPMIDIGHTGTGYGLGWTIGKIQTSRETKRLIYHPGDADGNSAFVSFLPDDGIGVIVLTNQHCTENLVNIWPERVVAAIYNHLLQGRVDGELVLPPRAGLPMGAGAADAAPLAAPAIAPAIASPAGYTGMFSNAGYGDMVINRSGDTLNINYYGLTWLLHPQPNNLFRFDVIGFGTVFPVFVKFSRNSSGAIDGFAASLVIHPTVLWIPFLKR